MSLHTLILVYNTNKIYIPITEIHSLAQLHRYLILGLLGGYNRLEISFCDIFNCIVKYVLNCNILRKN